MPDEDYMDVKFMGPAITAFREAFPDLPPADEIIVKIKLGQCAHCGKDMKESEFGGLDVVGITEEGEIVGEHVCADCMDEGK